MTDRRDWRGRSARALIGWSCFGLLCFAAVVRSQPLPGFEPNDDWVLEIDGKSSPQAQLYWSSRARAFLIFAPNLPAPVVLSPPTSQVRTVPIMKLARNADGSIDILTDPGMTDKGRFRFEGGVVRFSVDDRQVEMREKPVLLGWQDAESIGAYGLLWARRAQAYRPQPAVVDGLRKYGSAAKLSVYFGSWCSHCQQKVPLVMRLAELLQGSRVEVDFYGLPRMIRDDPIARTMNISAVPTGVVFVEGREVGRIEGDGWGAPEVALRRILNR